MDDNDIEDRKRETTARSLLNPVTHANNFWPSRFRLFISFPLFYSPLVSSPSSLRRSLSARMADCENWFLYTSAFLSTLFIILRRKVYVTTADKHPVSGMHGR